MQHENFGKQARTHALPAESIQLMSSVPSPIYEEIEDEFGKATNCSASSNYLLQSTIVSNGNKPVCRVPPRGDERRRYGQASDLHRVSQCIVRASTRTSSVLKTRIRPSLPGSSISSTIAKAHGHTDIHTYIHTYIHASIHPYIHTYIHTYRGLACLPVEAAEASRKSFIGMMWTTFGVWDHIWKESGLVSTSRFGE